MNQEINNLADDLELEGNVRGEFITEMTSLIASLDDDDYDQFYDLADTVMQDYY